MELQSVYTVIVTDNMTQCRDFYTRWLGFEVVFESTWFTYLASTHNPSLGIAFMTPDHPSQPPGPETFNGKGMFVTLQVADAAMTNLFKSGQITAIYDKWFLKPVPPKGINLNVPMSNQFKALLTNPTDSGDPAAYK